MAGSAHIPQLVDENSITKVETPSSKAVTQSETIGGVSVVGSASEAAKIEITSTDEGDKDKAESSATDKETVDIVQMVLAGKVNKTLVNLLQTKGGNAIGLSGMDARLIEAKIKDAKLGYVGEITDVHINPIMDLLYHNYIPVVSTIACDKDGNAYNVNGDPAAAYIAGALGAKRLIMMTDIGGILKDKDDPSTIITNITPKEAQKLCENGTVNGGMIPKVECCITAIEQGVEKVIIMDGTVPHSILMELLTDEGAGTMVRGEK